jgi:hypothetical protein
MKKKMCRSVLALGLTALIGMPAVASAQATRSGPTFAIGGVPRVLLSDAAYDPLNDRYLVVSESNSHTLIEGQIVDTTGRRLSTVAIYAAPPAGYAQYPRVAYSKDVNGGAGGYLVVWHETPVGAGFTQVRGRLVDASGAPLTASVVISPEATGITSSTTWIVGPAVAYSSGSREFLVSWMGSYTVSNDIFFNRVGLSGTVLQPASGRITATTPDWERDPAIAYNPDADEFYVAYAGYRNAGGYAYVTGVRVKAGTGAIVAQSPEFTQTAGTLIPVVEYNTATKQYFLVWYHKTRTAAVFMGLPVNQDGTAAGALRIVSPYYVAYDALDVKYSPISGDYFLVTHGKNWEDAGVSINVSGIPIDNGFLVTNTPDVRAVVSGDGNFFPRLAASTKKATWLTVTSSRFTAVYGQFVTSSSTAGPGSPAPAPTTPTTPSTPPPPSPVPAPLMNVDTPGNATTVSTGGFQVAGWAIDRGAPSGSGVDAIHVYAWPVPGGNPTFLGAATYGIARPDVGGFYGPAFSSSGFSLLAGGLAPGTYDIAVYAHSTVTGNFDGRVKRVTVTAPLSIPRMWIDTPAPNQNTSQNLTIAGWALDVGSSTSSGVDAIHIYAYPAGGGSPIWLGAATYGHARPDVGGAFGASRFGASGFRLDTTIAPGTYTLVVFARSSVANTFNNAQTVTITVR